MEMPFSVPEILDVYQVACSKTKAEDKIHHLCRTTNRLVGSSKGLANILGVKTIDRLTRIQPSIIEINRLSYNKSANPEELLNRLEFQLLHNVIQQLKLKYRKVG